MPVALPRHVLLDVARRGGKLWGRDVVGCLASQSLLDLGSKLAAEFSSSTTKHLTRKRGQVGMPRCISNGGLGYVNATRCHGVIVIANGFRGATDMFRDSAVTAAVHNTKDHTWSGLMLR